MNTKTQIKPNITTEPVWLSVLKFIVDAPIALAILVLLLGGLALCAAVGAFLLGVVFSLLSLVFSGLWMYVQSWGEHWDVGLVTAIPMLLFVLSWLFPVGGIGGGGSADTIPRHHYDLARNALEVAKQNSRV